MIESEKVLRLIIEAENKGWTHEDIGKICHVTPNSVSRWKSRKKARPSKIALLEAALHKEMAKTETPMTVSELASGEKKLSEATMEDLANRAKELGYRLNFIAIN